MSIPPYFKYIVLTLLFTAASINLTRTTLNVLKSSKRLDEARAEVLALENERDELKKDLEYKNSDEFVEEKARTELNMILPGERLFVVPENILGKADKNADEIDSRDDISNIEMWKELFF